VGTYRLWPSTNGPSSVAADTTAYTLGVEFYTTAAVDLTGYWWWCTPGADTTAKSFELWQIVSAFVGTPIAGTAATSGTLTQNAWNWVPLASSVALTVGQRYRAGCFGAGGVNWYGATHNGWPADLVNGPLTAPSTADATNNAQSPYKQAASISFPVDTGGSNYWLDVQVVDAAAPPTAARSNAKGREAATFASGSTSSAQLKGREPVFSTGGEHP
jgi:hypothetical protein